MKKILSFLAFCFIISVAAHAYAACQFDRKTMGVIKQGCPKDVSAFVNRVVACQHFGSEPFDLDDEWGRHRKEELEQQLRELHCDALPQEKTALLKRYKKQPDISDFITNSDKLR